MNTSPHQLDLFYKVSLNPTYEIKRAMRLSVSKSHLSREEIVDRMNKVSVDEGMRTTISKATIDNWLKDSDQGRMPSPAWLTIFCYVMNDVKPINAMLNPLGCVALDNNKQKLLAWAKAEQEKRKITKKARLALEKPGNIKKLNIVRNNGGGGMMEPQSYKNNLKIMIRNRITELKHNGVMTSKGERMSMAAIGRAMDPPVSHVAVLLVIDGRAESRRIKDAIEKELDQVYWIRKAA